MGARAAEGRRPLLGYEPLRQREARAQQQDLKPFINTNCADTALLNPLRVAVCKQSGSGGADCDMGEIAGVCHRSLPSSGSGRSCRVSGMCIGARDASPIPLVAVQVRLGLSKHEIAPNTLTQLGITLFISNFMIMKIQTHYSKIRLFEVIFMVFLV